MTELAARVQEAANGRDGGTRGRDTTLGRLTYGVLTPVIVAGGGFTFWYRLTYNVMPGQGACVGSCT
jgi:hypothetical protein